MADAEHRNIMVIWGDDIGITNLKKAASFTIDQVVAKLDSVLTAGH